MYSTNKNITHKNVTQGIIHLFCSMNNTIITFTNHHGDAIFCYSAGSCGFKGHHRSSTLAATQVAKKAIAQLIRLGISNITINVNGIGLGRDLALETFNNVTIRVNSITDVTPVPHNGVKPRKVRK